MIFRNCLSWRQYFYMTISCYWRSKKDITIENSRRNINFIRIIDDIFKQFYQKKFVFNLDVGLKISTITKLMVTLK